MRLKRWDTQSLLMQASPGRSHIHHSQKYFFDKTALCSVSQILNSPQASSSWLYPVPGTLCWQCWSEENITSVSTFPNQARDTGWAALTPCQCYIPPTSVCALVISAKRIHSTRTAVLGKPLLFLAILPSYTLGWEPGCGDSAILGPQTQRGL